MANDNALRVYQFRNIPSTPIFYPVESVATAQDLIFKLAHAELNNPETTDHVLGLEVLEDDEWCDWYNDEGEGIDDLMATYEPTQAVA